MDDIVTRARTKMDETLTMVRQDFGTVRTGKASPTLVENIEITAYDGSAKLKVLELATIHVQDPHTLVLSPFDHSVLGDLSKGIQDSNTGLHPVVDENIIRISLPPLTEERRREMVKLVQQKAEAGKVMVRQVRHEAMEDIKKAADGDGISEDQVTRHEKEIQRLTDDFTQKIETLCDEKEEELMKI